MEAAPVTDPYSAALQGLALCARLHGVPVDPDDLRHAHPPVGDPVRELLRAARTLGFAANLRIVKPAQLDRLPCPLPVREETGAWHVLVQVHDGEVLLWSPGQGARRMGRGAFVATWSGEALLLRRAREEGARGRFGWSWFLPHLGRHRGLILEVLLASLCVQVLALCAPFFFQAVIDRVLAHHGLTTLDVLTAGLLLAAVFEVLLTVLRDQVLGHAARRLDVRLGAELFEHLLALPPAWFVAHRAGEVVARVRELEHVRAFLTGPGLLSLLDVLFALVFVGALYLLSPVLCAIVLASLPFYGLLVGLATPWLRRRMERQSREMAASESFLVETVNAMETVKSCALEPLRARHWEDLLARRAAAAFDAGRLSGVLAQSVALVGRMGQAAVLWFGARLVLEGRMTIGQLVAFNLVAARVSAPVLRLVQAWQALQQAGLSLARLREILDMPREASLITEVRAPRPRVRGHLCFQGVCCAYAPDGAPVLDTVDLDIPAGTVLGIVGPSGAGKSTIARLVQRLVVPRSGRVLLDGVDLCLLDPHWLRRRVAVVPQEARLFPDTVRANIASDGGAVDMERIQRATTLAGAHGFILELPRGYETVLGADGANLSGGQRQRIALARALYMEPAVLVLDEATSALDFESEQAIQRHMTAWTRGRTVIIIAHRLSALRGARHVVALERGRITEQGPPERLKQGNGFFARLVAAQS